MNHPDSPLTPLGHKQAAEAGVHLKWRIEEITNKKPYSLTMECSPFFRCLETSSHIAKELNVKNINFNYHWGEWLADWLYQTSPIPNVESQRKTLEEINRDF